ncbi:MAG: 6-carboxytetrahydropterin synthase [Deltaproteobacteria bacterium]|nr:6-carboxytetrahydropterin synthase [Deltaproteobacteria bacterium]MDQ3295585.1 6-carboxytetrahydropterin synthase [Myxococcota bacterium]
MSRHRISIARDQYKFSVAHMTVFPDGTKERLHGHNYTVALAIEVSQIELASMIPFAAIKDAIGVLCVEWKERVLVATKNPFFVLVRDDARELEFTLCDERYVLPRQDVLLLPIDNISVEALASHVATILLERIKVLDAPHVKSLEITIEEYPGQGASCMIDLD